MCPGCVFTENLLPFPGSGWVCWFHQLWSSLELPDAEVAQGFTSTPLVFVPQKSALGSQGSWLVYKGSASLKICPAHAWECNTGAWLAQFWLSLGALEHPRCRV